MVVVGAGIIGLSIALELLEQSRDVRVAVTDKVRRLWTAQCTPPWQPAPLGRLTHPAHACIRWCCRMAMLRLVSPTCTDCCGHLLRRQANFAVLLCHLKTTALRFAEAGLICLL